MARTLWRVIVQSIRKDITVGLTDLAMFILLAPAAMFFGWIMLSNFFRYTYGSTTASFSTFQWLAAYTISGYFLLAILFYILRLPFAIFFKLRIKTLVLDQEHRNEAESIACQTCLKWLWFLGDESSSTLCYTPTRYIYASFIVHYASAFLYVVGILSFFMLIGAMIATFDFSIMDMLSLWVMAVAELVKNAF